MRGLAILVSAVLAALVGSSSAAALRKVTVMSATCQGASGPFPNPDSCRSFLQCEPSGRATVMPCPASLEFNPKLRVCDFPDRAGCLSSSSPPDGDDSSGSSGSGDDSGSGSSSGDDSGSGGGSGDDSGSGSGSDDGGVAPPPPSDDVPTCPPWNPNDVTQLPNPNDCSSFYKCDENGVAWVVSCPAGLEYNAKLRVCDYPENAGCSASSNPSDDTPSEGGQDGGSSDGGNEATPKPPSGDAPTCPAWNPDDVTQLPNPSDCSSFYKCDENGVAWLLPCPAGLEYNAKLRICDFPESAGCSSPAPSDPSGDGSSDGDQNNGNGDSGNDESPQQPSGDAPTCPPWNPNDVTQLPNPNDCSSFYKCDENGVAWEISCPAGLEYNAKLRVCDYPENAGCSASSPSNPSDDTPSEGGQDGGNSDGGSEVTPKPPSGDAPTCPAWNPDDVTQLPNPSDCSSFYKCDENGVAWLLPCPAGLEYNAKLRICDFPESAGCSSPAPSDPSGDGSSDGDQNNGNGDSGNDESPQQPSGDAPTCPPWNPNDVTQLPNPSDCSSFYKCDENGVAWLIPCPAGLQYNAELRVCDYAGDAGCSV